MNPFEQRKDFLSKLRQLKPAQRGAAANHTPENLFFKCPSCQKTAPQRTLAQTCRVCPACGYHVPVPAYYRLQMLLDSGTFRELNPGLRGDNPLHFPQYEQKLASLRATTGLQEAVVTATGKLQGHKAVVCVMDSRFLMGSMGCACGEKITRAFEYATQHKLPLIILCASGGARMQEGILSLMQMAKTAAAAARHAEAKLLYISVLTHPTTGGVTASFASLGDIILAEPGALIGFAGPRVIAQTIGQTLPEGFQRAEYLKEHGFVDAIVPRDQLKPTLAALLRLHKPKRSA